jgi:hypothetical protein
VSNNGEDGPRTKIPLVVDFAHIPEGCNSVAMLRLDDFVTLREGGGKYG